MLVNQTTKVVSAFILLLSIVLLVSHFPASYRKEIPFASQLPFTCFESARKVVGPFDHDLLVILLIISFVTLFELSRSLLIQS